MGAPYSAWTLPLSSGPPVGGAVGAGLAEALAVGATGSVFEVLVEVGG
jgi:hypothetical protein